MISNLVLNDGMKTIAEIRRDNLKRLVNETASRTLREVSDLTNVNPAYLSQIKNALPDHHGNPREMGDAIARRLELGMGKPKAWMDNDHGDIEPPPARSAQPTVVEKVMRALAPALASEQSMRTMIEENRKLAAELRAAKQDIALLKSKTQSLKPEGKAPKQKTAK